QRQQPGRAAAHAVGELAVGHALVVVDVGDLAGARRIELQQVGREVEALGRRRGQSVVWLLVHAASGRLGWGITAICCIKVWQYSQSTKQIKRSACHDLPPV